MSGAAARTGVFKKEDTNKYLKRGNRGAYKKSAQHKRMEK